MKYLQNSEINAICLNVLTTSKQNDLFLHSIFETLYFTGLRINEVLEFDRWTITADNNFTCITEKKSFIRTFKYSEISQLFADLLISNNTHLLTFNYRAITRAFNKFSLYNEIYTDKKQLTTHLFRHNKAKQLKQSNLSDYDIQNYLGEKDLKNALNYINSLIYTK